MGEGNNSVVEGLLTRHQALGSIPIKKEKKLFENSSARQNDLIRPTVLPHKRL